MEDIRPYLACILADPDTKPRSGNKLCTYIHSGLQLATPIRVMELWASWKSGQPGVVVALARPFFNLLISIEED